MTRRSLTVMSMLVLPLVLAIVAIVIPAQASGAKAGGANSARQGLVMVSPVPGIGPRTAAEASAAANTCAWYAVRAGWADNGYYSGDLVTAAAICVAESAGHPLLYTCDKNGVPIGHGYYAPGKPVKCPSGYTSYDRGLWQLSNVYDSSVTDSCAFNPVCNAGQAYAPASQYGTSFGAWSSYDSDTYAADIDAAQAAVTKLTAGTVTSAELGECLAPAKSAVNVKVVVINCGSGANGQQWLISGGKLRSGSVCAAIGLNPPKAPGVVLRRCASTKTQDWSVYGRGELRNLADGKCLTDPSGSLTAGTQVDVTACANLKDQTWWLP